jgi:hypothetical protein
VTAARRQRIASWCIVAWALCAAAPAWADGFGWLAPWYGSYVFDGAAGHTVGGSPIAYHYSLMLRRAPAGPTCALHLEGYQQDEMLRCTVHGDRNVLAVAFASYANGALANAYGVRVFQPDALLFRLTRPGSAESAGVMTAWLALHPDGVAETGAFFRRNGG